MMANPEYYDGFNDAEDEVDDNDDAVPNDADPNGTPMGTGVISKCC